MTTLSIPLPITLVQSLRGFIRRNAVWILIWVLCFISIYSYLVYLDNGLGLAYNDARSHLNIGRRVVEGLKTGMAQLGSVWLPLPHALMIPTIWIDGMWHTGLSGALQSMISYVVTGVLIYFFLKRLHIGVLGTFVGLAVYALNANVLYMQSTAMTELLLLVMMTAGVYELVRWHENRKIIHLLQSGFWIMMSTLIRYDGWFLFIYATGLIGIQILMHARTKAFNKIEGSVMLFCTLAGFGIVLWFVWNLLIFGDPLYFAFGEFSAHHQQAQLESAGVLATKKNLPLSVLIYIYAMFYNAGSLIAVFGIVGFVMLMLDTSYNRSFRIAMTALIAPFLFNILALYLGHSVIFVQGISGNTWFNVRYGLMMVPSIAIFTGYFVHKLKDLRYTLAIIVFLSLWISYINFDAVTVDDARFGSSQKNVTEVSGWLRENAMPKEGFVLISAASHDAIIFSSGMKMSRFIHEGTGEFWESATGSPDRWARWIIMRTNDNNDMTYRLIKKSPGYLKYRLVHSYPFADIYELKDEYLAQLNSRESVRKEGGD